MFYRAISLVLVAVIVHGSVGAQDQPQSPTQPATKMQQVLIGIAVIAGVVVAVLVIGSRPIRQEGRRYLIESALPFIDQPARSSMNSGVQLELLAKTLRQPIQTVG